VTGYNDFDLEKLGSGQTVYFYGKLLFSVKISSASPVKRRPVRLCRHSYY